MNMVWSVYFQVGFIVENFLPLMLKKNTVHTNLTKTAQ